MKFLKEMEDAEKQLREMGFKVFVPEGLIMVRSKKWTVPPTQDGKIEAVKKYDFIRKHYSKIIESDAVLVLNYDKDGVINYIGPNTFLEMGFAFVSGKKIFLLNPIPDSQISPEVQAMSPVILNGDFNNIKSL